MTVTTLLLVDVQKDFHPGGSLAIPTAGEDAERIAKLIRDHASKIDRVVATMDSHQKLHIAHPGFWRSGETGEHPNPFTLISSSDVAAGKWIPRSDVKVPPGTVDAAVFGGDVAERATGFRGAELHAMSQTERPRAAKASANVSAEGGAWRRLEPTG